MKTGNMFQPQGHARSGAARRPVFAFTLAAALWSGALFPLPFTADFAAAPAQAQNLFAPRLYVNGEVITEYEVGQRALFLQVLGAPGDPETEALKGLIDDRLRLSEGKRMGIDLTPDEVKAAMEEFASRASLTADQFVAELQKLGIGVETYRDFVRAGAIWRKIMRDRYISSVPVTESEVDRFIESAIRPKALRAQVSELVIPVEPGREAEIEALAARLAGGISGEAGFAAAAREYSASPTAENGGRIPEWLPLAQLPPAIAGQLVTLGPGKVTAPIAVPGAVVLFQLRALEADPAAPVASVQVEYADLTIVDDAALYSEILGKSDVCNDLYATAGVPAEQLKIETKPASALPADIAAKLATLDQGETAILSRGNGALRLVMLCKRSPLSEPGQEVNRAAIKDQIQNQKLEGLAEGDLEELRHAALIREP